MTLIKMPSMRVILALLMPYMAHASSDLACPYLPLEAAPAIEFFLPPNVYKDFSKELPSFVFEGIKPVVTRKIVPFGARPKIIFERYSSTPRVTYDEIDGTIVVQSHECSVSSSATKFAFPWLGIAASVFLGGFGPDRRYIAPAMGLACFMMTSQILPCAKAQDDECLPTLKVVIEAPAATMNAVEACWAEVKNPEGVCPDPFPTFPTCDDIEPKCTVAIVGAATGGLYAALRFVDSGAVPADDVCIFEMQGRAGGRAFSMRGLGPYGDLSVDPGGYRTWPKYTPSMHTLVTEYLGIPVACYDNSDPCTKYTIVDKNGEKAGFATFNEEMLTRLVDGGACWYPHHELIRMEKMAEVASPTATARSTTTNRPTKLYFANGVNATATFATVLNTPQRPLLKIIRNSNLDDAGILDLSKLKALHSVQTTISSKLYLYYPKGHVFWKKLGLNSGDFSYPGDAQNMLLEGRYSDGHVKCDNPADPKTCHGFLLAVYATDFSGNKAQYFRRFQGDRSEPVTFITNQDLEGQEFLLHAHARLETFHRYENPGASYSAFQADQAFMRNDPPTFAVLATWNEAIPWVGAAYHGWTNLDNIELAMDPFGEFNIHVVGEAYSMLHGWAEGSIKVADEVLEKHYGIPRPWDFPVDDIEQSLHDTSSNIKTASCEMDSPSPSNPVTFDTLSEHSTADDCWSAIHDVVYDLTAFVSSHPGGRDSVIGTCGIDSSGMYDSFHSLGKLAAIEGDIVGQLSRSASYGTVALHATEDDCWTVVYGNIYDLTEFNHTGPRGVISGVCGIDGTAEYIGKHGTQQYLLYKITDLFVSKVSIPSTDVAAHNSVDDCWTVIDGNIYDLTDFNHTGPQSVIAPLCGSDGTEDFLGKHGGRPELLEKISTKLLGSALTETAPVVGGSTSGEATSGGGSAKDDVFCFLAGSLVEMVDGKLKYIEDVQEGDRVRTGTGRGKGLVTKKLVHPIENEVLVAKIVTWDGVLSGTPSHPVFQGGEWIKLEDLKQDDHVLMVRKAESEYVNVFYNLEIDADEPGKSSHSYVVNGVVASGLGDNPILNLLYPRQQSWKDMVAKEVKAQ